MKTQRDTAESNRLFLESVLRRNQRIGLQARPRESNKAERKTGRGHHPGPLQLYPGITDAR